MAIIREDNNDARADTSTQYTIEPGDVFQGTLGPAGDTDWIKIELSAGTIYDISLDGVESDQFRLFNSNGGNVIYGPYLLPYSTLFKASGSGTYYIAIARTNYDDSDNYEISFLEHPLSIASYDEIASYLKRSPDESYIFDVAPGGTLTANVTALTEDGQQLARWALDAWTDVTGIEFEFVDNNANISFDDDDLGSAYSSYTAVGGIKVSSHINVGADWLTTYGSGIDSFTFYAYLHEIGHALGLNHPGPYDGRFPDSIDKIFGNDSYQTTVMSYFRQDSDNFTDASFAIPVTPMIADIIAIQDLYGAPLDINPGNTLHGHGSNVEGYMAELFERWTGQGDSSFGNPVTLTLYDSGGIDTLDLSTDSSNQRVDLRPEGISDVYGLVGNLIIARDTLIENFIAGSGNDVVLGNDTENLLQGRDGNDDLRGYGGNDVLEGGAGADRLDGDAGMDWVSYQESGSAVIINLAQGTLRGGHAEGDVISEIESVIGSAYGDVLEGDSGANWLNGGPGNDEVSGNGGNDVLEGSTGGDRLAGGAGEDTASYGQSTAGVVVRLHSGEIRGGDAEGDTFTAMVMVEYIDNNGDTQHETVPDIEHLLGSAHADTLAGDSRSNRLAGGAGDDRLFGGPGGGNDVLLGGPGADALYGGAGDDVLAGGPDADTLRGGPGDDTATYEESPRGVEVRLHSGVARGGDAEGDMLDGIEHLAGSAYADTLEGNADANRLYGADGADELSGNGGNDMLEGGAGSDVLKGGAGADVLNGGAGVDWLSYAGSDAGVDVRLRTGTGAGGHAEGDVIAGFENIEGSDYNDIFGGDSNDNHLSGGAGNDGLWGGSGNDVLEGGAGADRMFGDTGIDWVIYPGSDTGVTVNLAEGTGTGGHAEGDTIAGVENVEGSDHNDVLEGNDSVNRLYGGEGDDELHGGRGDDILEGGAGADRLDGGAGIDAVIYRGSDEAVTINISDGTTTGGHAEGDVILGVERIIGSLYGDTLVGGDGIDRLDGDGGDDILEGGAGADRLEGGAGMDTAVYRNSNSAVTVNLGNGTLTGGHAEGDVIINIEGIEGSAYDDELTGDNGPNRLEGGDGDDELRGNAGNDQIFGGGGNDLLEGGEDIDLLDGGPGTDTVSYENSTLSVDVSLLFNGASTFNYNDGEELIDIENVIGSDYGDILRGDSGINEIYGGGGDDNINGLAGDDRLFGEAGDDQLWGQAGADQLHGGEGVDTVVYWFSDEAVTVNLKDGTAQGGHANGDMLVGIENLWGSEHDDILTGDDGANRLIAELGNNEFYGNGGDDVLESGAGADLLDGGQGMDTVSYKRSSEGVTVNLGEGIGVGGHAEGDVIVNVENMEGSFHDDVLVGDDKANRLSGWVGNDELEGGEGADHFIFSSANKNDIILDFTDNEDLIDLTGFRNISGFDDLTITSDSDGVTIDLRAYRGGTILLEGFDIANLDASDFIF